jgi:hypothetical protein
MMYTVPFVLLTTTACAAAEPMDVSVDHEKTHEAPAFGADVEKAPAMKARVTAETINLAVNLQLTFVPILNPFLETLERRPRRLEDIGGPHINR